jgi:hypothetical protein
MTNPLKHAHEVTAFSAAYQVVRTAIVVLDEQTYRIEVLKAYAPSTAPYTAHCWVQQTVTVPLASLLLPRKVQREDVTVWVRHPFPSPVEGKRPKAVLAQALHCLAEQAALAHV